MEINSQVLIDNFRCPICWEIVEEPCETTCCGNLFCEKCLLSYISSKCPMCRKENLKYRKNMFAKNLLTEYEGNFMCPHGCNKKIKLKEFKEHKYECEDAIFKCSINKCDFEGKRKNALEHLIYNHENILTLLSENYQSFKGVFNKFEIFNNLASKNINNNSINNNKINPYENNEDKKC